MPLAERGAQAAERLVAFLLGVDLSDTPPDLRIEVVRAEAEQLGRERSVAELAAMLALDTPVPLLVAGPDAAGIVAAAAGRPVVLVDAVSAGDPQLLREAALVAALERGLVALGGVEQLEPGPARAMQRWIASRGDRVILCGRTRARRPSRWPTSRRSSWRCPSRRWRSARAAWRVRLRRRRRGGRGGEVPVSIGQVEQAAEVAKVVASSAGRAPGAEDLDFGARSASSGARPAGDPPRAALRLGRPDPAAPLVEVLQSISAYIRHRDLVLSEWGYERTVARNQGVKTLFAGDSGTGKTMAQVLASDLGQEIFRIDLATVVSKYIGETEKNLDRIFAAAQGSNAILFFDEADALFGKRSDVQDAHDRYANLEVAYLLQRMESYAGAVVLATNYRQNIDEAFLRRLDFVVDFPFPEPPDRERIWRLLLHGAHRRPTTSTSPSSPTSSSWPAATSATHRWRPRSWRPRTAA